MRRLLALAAAAVVLSAPVACIFFTASTDGYTTVSEGGAQGIGSCSSATDCGEDAGLVCCAATATGAGACQPAPCGIQLCTTGKECSAGTCVDQLCHDQEVHACGHLPGCSKRGVDASAGGEDAGSVDTGSSEDAGTSEDAGGVSDGDVG